MLENAPARVLFSQGKEQCRAGAWLLLERIERIDGTLFVWAARLTLNQLG